MLFVFIHVGFELPRGTMGWWLLGLSLWTTATGVAGTMLQKWIPLCDCGIAAGRGACRSRSGTDGAPPGRSR